jgi:nitrate reductase delta subunit
MMDRTLKALSLTLSYPSAELQDAMPEIGDVLGTDPRIAPDTRAALQRLAEGLGQGDLYDIQESYVMLFDRSRTLSLNLFEHVHGESRERGGAMVSLI